MPTVTLTLPPLSPFIGTNVDLAVNFTNPSTGGATRPGYAPWTYVVLPATGADGNDGLSYVAGSANYLGASVTTSVQTFANGRVTGPAFARDPATDGPTSITAASVGARNGDQVVFFQLPFGSFAVDQPNATIKFQAALSNLADVGTPLDLEAGGGFALGATPTDDFPADRPITAAATAATVTPVLIQLKKIYNGPENETATGPNFPESFTIEAAVAPGQTITNFNLTDLLPDGMQFLGAGSVTGTDNGGTFQGVAGTATATTPGGSVIGTFNRVVGTGADTDARLTFGFYVPRDYAAGGQVVPLNTGAFQPLRNGATAGGDWTPIDPRDPAGPATSTAAPVTITAKSLAVQKGVSVVGNGPVVQGSTLQYTISFQISDYFALDQLVLPDLLPDGVRFDPTFQPILQVNQHTAGSAAAVFGNNNFAVGGVNADGTQTVTFAVSNELAARTGDGRLVGGDLPTGGTGSNANPPPDGPTAPFAGTTGQITFRAVVQPSYSVKQSPTGNKDVKQGDILTNVVSADRTNPQTPTAGGRILQYANATAATGNTQADGSTVDVKVARGALTKTLYAINGNTAVPAVPKIQAGDRVTYRLTYTLPTGTAENFKLTDYLPLPVFNAPEVTTFDAAGTGVPPAGAGPVRPERPVPHRLRSRRAERRQLRPDHRDRRRHQHGRVRLPGQPRRPAAAHHHRGRAVHPHRPGPSVRRRPVPDQPGRRPRRQHDGRRPASRRHRPGRVDAAEPRRDQGGGGDRPTGQRRHHLLARCRRPGAVRPGPDRHGQPALHGRHHVERPGRDADQQQPERRGRRRPGRVRRGRAEPRPGRPRGVRRDARGHRADGVRGPAERPEPASPRRQRQPARLHPAGRLAGHARRLLRRRHPTRRSDRQRHPGRRSAPTTARAAATSSSLPTTYHSPTRSSRTR